MIAFLPLLFLHTPHSLFPSTFSPALRYILLGCLASTYPLAQILSAPLLGHLSDRIGRKGILLTSYLGNTVGYLLCGFGILNHSLSLLYIGNFIAGLTGVNLSTTNAMISDVSATPHRPKFFATSQLMLGLGFILGPLVAGKVVVWSSHLFDACFYLFLACALFSLINFFLISRFWSSTDGSSVHVSKFSWKNFLSCERPVTLLLLAEFLIFFGWYFFIKTFQVFLIEGISCSESQVFSLYSQYGLWFTVSQLVFLLFLHRYVKSPHFFRLSLTLFALSIFLLFFATSYNAVAYIIPLFTLGYGLLMPSLTSLISEYATLHNHGQIMGLHQSVQAIAKISGPLLAGCALTLTPLATVFLSPLFILGGYAVLSLLTREKQTT